ncbi:hypothetical protein CLV63_11367 [Murinocardiopsis flavida]|uniref:DUF2269 domain-containing protein n=1 Tax=Murinocardiopsis flavida TaxID=645275 RepID=A0A2P8DFB3_9ACTN|nr:hypothetical protein [Murinocardiopsis flavida]PSK95904.1 hypothetical protein CLV63_11367 [Murinocardiopsis flavida]
MAAPQPQSFPRLGAGTRKTVLVTHIVSAGAWIGIDATLGILVVTGLLTDDPAVAATSFQALELFAVWPMLTAALCCLVTGSVLGLGSKYGLVRYWWVAAKLVINVGMCVLIYFALRPGLGDAAEYGRRVAEGTAAGADPSGLLAPVVVAPTLLLAAVLLSVFKPWGRIARRAAAPLPAPVRRTSAAP